MQILRKHGWQIKETLATPEDVFVNRRQLLASAGAIGLIGAGAGAAHGFSLFGSSSSVSVEDTLAATKKDPTFALYPFKRNAKYKLDRPLTDEKINSTYNNFYEFGSHKQIYGEAQKLPLRPWAINIEGLVEKPFTIGIDDLFKKMSIEERLYRHRCVEAWSMTIPWTGFPLADLVALAKPLSSAKFVRLETFMNKKVASGQKEHWYPWPYVEAVTMAEATNELAFMVTGAYGKPLAKQFGAPLRLHLPWKYGFKSIKSVVRISFTDKRPKGFWEDVQAKEYGFWANVNPKVPHPRWSQATERVLDDKGSRSRIPTKLYNGYGEYVAHLYKDLKNEVLYR